MTDRLISRRNGKPVTFTTQSVQYIEIGHKKNPQMYTTNCRIHHGKCRKLRHQ